MFEAFVMLCLDGTEPCRTALRPGWDAATEAACADAIARDPPSVLSGQTGAAFCAPRPETGLAFDEVVPGVFVHLGAVAEAGPDNLGDVANIAFVVGSHSVAVIDAGGSRAVGEAAYLAIRERTDLPIVALILTHMHPDHVFGAAVFREAGAGIIGRAGLGRALAERDESYREGFSALIGAEGFLGTEIVPPDREVTAVETLDLGGRVLRITPRPTAHTATDLTVFDTGAGVLFAGDLVFHDHAPALDGSLKGWQAVLAAMAEESASLMVPGHGGPVLPWPEGAEPLRRYLDTLAADTRAALAAGQPLSAAAREIGRGEAANWRLFDLFNARNATTAYTELEWE